MANTTFVDQVTVVVADWLNDVNDVVYDVLGDGTNVPSNSADVRTNIGLGNVDNTSDANKPISGPQAAGLVAKTSAIGSAVMPTGTTGERDGSPLNGYTRFNTTLQTLEVYNAATATWIPAGQGATGPVGNPIFYENDQIVTGDYTIIGTKNAMSTGPITIALGVTVTVDPGAVWVIL